MQKVRCAATCLDGIIKCNHEGIKIRLRQVPGSLVSVPVPLGRPELVPCRQRRRANAPLTWLQQ
jgi:hypothetical protein